MATDQPAPLFTVHRHIKTGEQRTVERGGQRDRQLAAHDDWCTTTLGGPA